MFSGWRLGSKACIYRPEFSASRGLIYEINYLINTCIMEMKRLRHGLGLILRKRQDQIKLGFDLEERNK